MSSSILEQDFAESDNMMAAQSEEASIDSEWVAEGDPVAPLETTSSPTGWQVENVDSGSVVASPGS